MRATTNDPLLLSSTALALWHEPNLLIDGALVAAEGGRMFDSINPATEELVAPAADATVADAERAIGAARRAFEMGVAGLEEFLQTKLLAEPLPPHA